MKKYLTLVLLSISTLCFSQIKQMMEALKLNQPDKAIKIGQDSNNDSNSFEMHFLFAKAYNQKKDYKNAELFIEKAKVLSNENWQKAWISVESIQTYYGLGKISEAKNVYEKAKEIPGTKNSDNELKYWGILFGFDELYKDWKTVESKNLIFHFQNTISEENIKSIVSSRQDAFDKINSFFKSELPKKIDFFIWDLPGNYNPHLNKNLGFTNPEFCISHNRTNQSAGHEIAHNILHWRNPNSLKLRFINEGIAVYFDQNKNDKMTSAKEINLSNPVSIQKMWQDGKEIDESLLYPISGAFVGFLIKYDKDKFLQLSENQTYENAKIIYGDQLDDLISNFTKELNSKNK